MIYLAQEYQKVIEQAVRMLNINQGHNGLLMEKCRVLKEYAAFVDVTRRYAEERGSVEEALTGAVEYCIENGILEEFLKENRAEVLGMLLEEFDVKKYERTLRSEGREEGREEGIREGMELGRKQGIADLVANALIELVDNDENNREVTYKQLNEYGALVIETLNARNEEAVLIVNAANEKCIALREGKTTDRLKDLFRGYLSLDMLLAFISEHTVQALGI